MDALTIVFYGNKTLMDALTGLDMVHWDTPNVCGVWSVKNIVSHLTAYELLCCDILGMFTGAPDKPMFDRMMESHGTWNDATVADRAHFTPEQALEEYAAAHAEKTARATQVGAEILAQVGTIPWYGNGYALDDYLVYADYGHKREHAAQIMVFRDTLA